MNVPQLVNHVILGMVNIAALMPVHVTFVLPRREGILGSRSREMVCMRSVCRDSVAFFILKHKKIAV
jgi:hypothetical protein